MNQPEIVGIDAGNYKTKVVGQGGIDSFYSDIGTYRERKLVATHGDDDMVFDYRGQRGFAGTLAKVETRYGGTIGGETKAHDDALLRVLLGLHRYATKHGVATFNIVVGQPISRHTDAEKAKIKRMFAGGHEITVNNVRKTIRITRVEVAAEGGAAFWSAPESGLIRIIDVGSATINCASLLNGSYVDLASFTLGYGLDPNDLSGLVRAITINAIKNGWAKTDEIRLVGGAANVLEPLIRDEFPNTKVLPRPMYANAIGFYTIGRRVYGG